MTLGDSYEWSIGGAPNHPFHLHTSPFQLVGNTYEDNVFFQNGDWHDTFLNPGVRGEVTVRYRPTDFVGTMVLHCHILEHEDKGMMAVAGVVAEQGGGRDGQGW
eukprot:CAMPEP_0113951142 /NCGR_PEP_ID=MMETSP1339-20121228/84574_1 /TAXON_ID=94617 /ORGANISM="Fibrocapsa japonica" /LENGTH=103 /DNA_ID=CAMNT_0000959279 /DNA_START=159 /DNA_END=467 /DNA_ORIENTATION=+ /assembly_acc=CAM_ASM_000762